MSIHDFGAGSANSREARRSTLGSVLLQSLGSVSMLMSCIREPANGLNRVRIPVDLPSSSNLSTENGVTGDMGTQTEPAPSKNRGGPMIDLRRKDAGTGIRASRPSSHILVDGGDPQDTRRIKLLLRFVDGQTMNPSLIAKISGRTPR